MPVDFCHLSKVTLEVFFYTFISHFSSTVFADFTLFEICVICFILRQGLCRAIKLSHSFCISYEFLIYLVSQCLQIFSFVALPIPI